MKDRGMAVVVGALRNGVRLEELWAFSKVPGRFW
jgi:hypothetical protein